MENLEIVTSSRSYLDEALLRYIHKRFLQHDYISAAQALGSVHLLSEAGKESFWKIGLACLKGIRRQLEAQPINDLQHELKKFDTSQIFFYDRLLSVTNDREQLTEIFIEIISVRNQVANQEDDLKQRIANLEETYGWAMTFFKNAIFQTQPVVGYVGLLEYSIFIERAISENAISRSGDDQLQYKNLLGEVPMPALKKKLGPTTRRYLELALSHFKQSWKLEKSFDYFIVYYIRGLVAYALFDHSSAQEKDQSHELESQKEWSTIRSILQSLRPDAPATRMIRFMVARDLSTFLPELDWHLEAFNLLESDPFADRDEVLVPVADQVLLSNDPRSLPKLLKVIMIRIESGHNCNDLVLWRYLCRTLAQMRGLPKKGVDKKIGHQFEAILCDRKRWWNLYYFKEVQLKSTSPEEIKKMVLFRCIASNLMNLPHPNLYQYKHEFKNCPSHDKNSVEEFSHTSPILGQLSEVQHLIEKFPEEKPAFQMIFDDGLDLTFSGELVDQDDDKSESELDSYEPEKKNKKSSKKDKKSKVDKKAKKAKKS